MLTIENLKAAAGEKEILKGLDLQVNPGEVHAIMGPNGSGKSSLAHILAGREGLDVTDGSVKFDGSDLLELEPEERAAAGVFLAFQYPVELPGVNNTHFLKEALNAQRRNRGEEELDSVA
ncbi:MAG: ATP-binding cassette domain-containing protein, partial [Sedimenticolaceae bacterium]|nr:ATP-binding cassette domain-containing protein [Sedimenticolaceae bacterium]